MREVGDSQKQVMQDKPNHDDKTKDVQEESKNEKKQSDEIFADQGMFTSDIIFIEEILDNL